MNGLLVEYQTKANILVNATVLETEKSVLSLKLY